ncbi:MAG: hypothetical protein AVDCRST_MAG68-675 [uncultured Gemmatimonadetes bacterium]|uniref:Uncharacterized protein n=1 Tax=uncultured Gemmatimonadota bacterium TaxID=203437 RepID=A0A6J4KCM0_9BACT|nr:MAG: hypothetical protein AVDCRST_MAG68-675 [uncultured Gemmatimonadota bacterium]
MSLCEAKLRSDRADAAAAQASAAGSRTEVVAARLVAVGVGGATDRDLPRVGVVRTARRGLRRRDRRARTESQPPRNDQGEHEPYRAFQDFGHGYLFGDERSRAASRGVRPALG